MNSKQVRDYHRLCLATLVAVYVLIGVGAIVRSTGSGMGCPDWPKCFGRWIPPSGPGELPPNYKEINAALREKKNLKFVKYLRAFGFSHTADQLASGPGVLHEEDFDVTKAWIEYVNRLVGVVIGFFIMLLAWESRGFGRSHPSVFYLSLLALAAVIFQGWFGSIVVSTNLTTWTVTVHMFLALALVVLLVFLFRMTETFKQQAAPGLSLWLIACMAALLIQIYLGTRVRETVDVAASQGVERARWISRTGSVLTYHAFFSAVVLALNTVLLSRFRQIAQKNALLVAIQFLILGNLLSGVVMMYGGIPAFMQPIHLLLATAAFGLQLLLFFRIHTRPVMVLD